MASDFRVAGIDHVELFVPDRYEAAKWYQQVLGLEIVPEFEHWSDNTVGPLMISSSGPVGTKLALFDGKPQGHADPVGIRRIAFAIDGHGFLQFLDRLHDIPLRSANGTTLSKREVVDHELSCSIYFVDPWGNRLELTTYDHAHVRAALQL